jgi:hypothetical protein
LPPTLAEQIETALAASRWEADRVLDFGRQRARTVEAAAEGEAEAVIRARLAQLEGLRDSIDRHRSEIDTGYARLLETLAGASSQLVEIAREADFSPPASEGGLNRTLELKLTETRELTVRFTQPAERGPE